jgi:hypothetical protein
MGLTNLMPFIDPDAGGPAAREAFRRTMDSIAKLPPSERVCPHVVPPEAAYSVGTFTCSECGEPVKIDIPLTELVTSDD